MAIGVSFWAGDVKLCLCKRCLYLCYMTRGRSWRGEKEREERRKEGERERGRGDGSSGTEGNLAGRKTITTLGGVSSCKEEKEHGSGRCETSESIFLFFFIFFFIIGITLSLRVFLCF